jgi:two-component system, chemotaxis family, chemotaxis protein CheY
MKKILVADDSEFIRKVLKETLSLEYDVVMAKTGKQTLDMYKKEKPDLTLLDIIMPEGEEEGLQVLEKLIEMDKKAVVIMITAVGQDTIRAECKGLGAKGYITKPFSEEDVLKEVSKYLK